MNINNLKKSLEGLSAEDILTLMLSKYKNKIALASSLGLEDQVLTDMMMKIDNQSNIFTLDTGRLPKQTYDLMEKVNQKYKIKLKVFFPSNDLVETMVNQKGMFSFYDSIDNRKECCYVRKMEPLKRALGELEVWITGLRASQSVTRENSEVIEWDEANGLIKLNPLISWSEADVWEYIKKHNVPYNKLHDMNYPSIGCEPCTRAVEDSTDIRSGRWWWENPESKECGLHIKKEQTC